MPPEILALLDKPLSLIAVLFVGALAGMAVELLATQRPAPTDRSMPPAPQPYVPPTPSIAPAPRVEDADLEVVPGADERVEPAQELVPRHRRG